MRHSIFAALISCSSALGCSSTPADPVAMDTSVDSGLNMESGVAILDTTDETTDTATDVVDTAIPTTTIAEKEPNDGKVATDVNAWPIPGDATGAIDPADDLDILSVTLKAGELWMWTLSGSGGMTPHLAISEQGNKVPTMVATGAMLAEQEHFVLETQTYFVIVRDARNVPLAMSKHVGGPDLKWRATARPLSRTATAATFPTTLAGKLDKRTSIALYSFSGTKDLGFDIVLRAERKTPASDMDSRMSLYEKTTKTWVLTNDDDVAAKTKDSHIGGLLPITGEYVVIVENVSPNAVDLSYELAFTKR